MNYHPATRSRPLLAALATAVLPVAFACGGSDTRTADKAPECTVTSDSIRGGALEKFIETRNPVPHRFLIPLGTDSVVPDGSHYVLNAAGRAMYTWPSDPTLVQGQIDAMRAKGSFTTLALFYHGDTTLADGRRSFEFSGRYIDKANDGVVIPRTKVLFNCQAPEGSRYVMGDDPAAGATPLPADTGKVGGG
jgi:hypothetical protein